jgi:hypothetical protein
MGAVRGGLPSVNRPCDRFCGRDACAKLGCQNATPEYFEETRGNPLGSLYPMAIEKLKMQEQFAFDWNNQQRTRAPKQRQAKVEPPGICPACGNQTFPKRIIEPILPDDRNRADAWSQQVQDRENPRDDLARKDFDRVKVRAFHRMGVNLVHRLIGGSKQQEWDDKEFDIRFGGCNLQVCMATNKDPYLLHSAKRRLTGDVIILCTPIDDDHLWITGWISLERFHEIAEPFHKQLNGGRPQSVNYRQLNGMDAFCRSCRRINGWST